MSEWREDTPDWRDDGRMVVVETDDGRFIGCKLAYDDFVTDGEDEFPLWFAVDAFGARVDFLGAKRWRFADQETVPESNE